MKTAPRDRDPSPPDVGPDDEWDDPACLSAENTASVALPAERPRKSRSPNESPGENGALRIDSSQRPRKLATEDPPQRGLEVQEINGTVLRLVPEMPPLERMPRRVTFQARGPGNGKKRVGAETGEWGRRPPRQSLLWVCGAGSVIAGLVVGAMVLLPRVNRANAIQSPPGGAELVIDRIVADEGPRLVAAMLQRQAEALELYRAFTGARRVEELLPLLHQPDTVEPLVRDSIPGILAPPAESVHNWNVKDDDGVIHGILDGMRVDHSKFQAYFIDVAGELRIAWKATTAYGTAEFAELAEGRGDPGEIRGWISPADFYTLSFPENGYRAYRLLSPDEMEALWVYAEVDGEAAQALEPWLRGGQILAGHNEKKKATLRLAPPPEGAMPNQWRLVELLHKEWIAPY